MKSLKLAIQRRTALFKADSLFRNAAFLMASTAIMSVLGFGFWVFAAHLYPSTEIGQASALISITLLASNLSFFGLNAGFIRFLPNSKQPSRDINAALIVVAAAAALAGAAYLTWVGDDFAGNLSLFHSSLFGQIAFIGLMAAIALNTLTDSIFIASRRAEFHTLAYAAFGVIRLILPLLLVRYGALGIFASYSVAVLASLGLTFIFLRYAIGYRFFSRPNWSFISATRRYASHNYIAGLLSGLSSQIMPTLIIHRLGAADAAYFAMAWTMANLLNVIPSAITNSLLAESSHNIARQGTNIRHASRILAITLVPAVSLAILVAPFILRLFGTQYAIGGTTIFQLLALSTFAIAGNSIGNTIMNIEQRSGGIVVVQAVIASVTLALAWPLMNLGLVGTGLAFLLGNVAGNLVQLGLLIIAKPASATLNAATPAAGPSAAIIQHFLEQYSLADAQVGKDLGGGDRSATIIVTAATNQYVLKIYSRDKHSTSQIEAEIKFTQFLLGRGIPVPRVHRNAGGRLIARVTDGKATWLGLLMDFELGHQPTSYSPALLRNMATVQGRIHLNGAEYAQKQRHSLKELNDSSLRSSLISYMPKGISHFDFDSGNLLVDHDHITCVVDFEGMRYDPLVVCLFFTLAHLYDQGPSLANLRIYLRAYQDVRPLKAIEKLVLRGALAARYTSPKLVLLRF